MQTFKIQKLKVHGIGKSNMIVLPAPWCYGHSIKPGDIVEASITGSGKLIIDFSKKVEGDRDG